MKFECYGASRPRDGATSSEDAFVIHLSDIPYAALCDGSDQAKRATKSVLRLFNRLFQEATVSRVLSDETSTRQINWMDLSIVGH